MIRFPIKSRRIGPCAVMVAALLIGLGGLPVRAQAPIQLRAKADQTQVQVGEEVQFTLSVQTGGGQLNGTPTVPDFGGLEVRGGPGTSHQIYQVNGRMQVTYAYTWLLAAPREGDFVIGPSRLEAGGKEYQTDPITIHVTRNQSPALPPDLRGESILSARTSDSDINKALEGRLFIRATVSNPTPTVGEPVIVRYDLFRDRVDLRSPLQDNADALATVPGALSEVISRSQSIQYQTVTIGGRQMESAPLFILAVTPSKAGEVTVPAYSLVGRLQVRRQRGRSADPFDDMFSSMDDPFFGGGLQVEVPAAPVVLNVKQLPTAGQPPDFTGTVGQFTIDAAVDRTEITRDDLLTLTVTLAGKGAIELANPPALKSSVDFDVVGQSNKLDKNTSPDAYGGKKTFEFLLRPNHEGQLTVPALRYPIFDPASQAYQVLETRPIPVVIKPGKGGPAPAADQGPALTRPEPMARQLRYLKTINAGTLQPRRPDPLFESAAFWGAQAAGLGLLTLAWARDRRRRRLDPTQVRRSGAWKKYHQSIEQIRREAAQRAPAGEVAARLEQAVRTLIADRFDLAPDGLTRREIEDLLRSQSMAEEKVGRLCDLLDQCATIRYAPTPAGNADLKAWIDELGGLLREGLRA